MKIDDKRWAVAVVVLVVALVLAIVLVNPHYRCVATFGHWVPTNREFLGGPIIPGHCRY
jgi:hypothetical protein